MQRLMFIPRVCRQMLTTLRYSLLNVMIFEIIYKIAVFIVINPLINNTASIFYRADGYAVVLNGQIGSFLFSIAGIIMMLIVGVISALVVYYEYAVLIILLYAGFQGGKIKLSYGLKAGINAISSLYSLSSAGFMLYALMLVPLLNFGVHSSLISRISLPAFITGEIEKYTGGSLALSIIMVLAAILFIKLAFVLPAMVLERLDFGAGARRSFVLLKGETIRTVCICLLAFGFWQLISRVVFVPYGDNSFTWVLDFLSGIGMDIVDMLSTPLMIAAVLVCYAPLSKPVMLDEDEMMLVDTRLNKIGSMVQKVSAYAGAFCDKTGRRIWERYVPEGLKKRPLLLRLFSIVPISVILLYIYSYFYNPYLGPCSIIGHRGSLEGVENTIQAVQGAVEQKADYAEIDILLSADGVPMVIHDSNLFRLSGNFSNVHELTAAELGEITLRQNEFEAKVPTLDALCKEIKGKGKLLIELKSHGHEKESIIDQVVAVVKENDMELDCIYHTTEDKLLEEMKTKYPDYTVGYVVIAGMGKITPSILWQMPADFYSFEESSVDYMLVIACHKAGKPIYVWTVNDEAYWKAYLEYRVDGIITDYPGDAKRYTNELTHSIDSEEE